MIAQMTNIDHIRCITSMLNFILNSDDELLTLGSFKTPSHSSLRNTLDRYGINNVLSYVELLRGSPFNTDDERKKFFFNKQNLLDLSIAKLNEYNK